uniref:Tetraspanin n=1 Tax=Onchocerca volvulus TaxID=6282 RepID=A0A2K6W3Y3_ONCVO
MLPTFFIQQLKIIALIFNSVFALISIFSLFVAVFSWFSPPSAGIFPSPVSDHHQYSLAVFFVGITSISIFLLSILGIVSLILCSSFCLFLYIIILLMQLSVQFILSAFALANQHKIHGTIISQWRALSVESFSNDCGNDAVCNNHLQLLNHVERNIFILLLIFFSFQVLLLFISCCYCNYLSEREAYEMVEKDDAVDNQP